jgi:Protein of unknown function (DUF3363)
MAETETATREAGFGRDALAQRHQWLVDQELARREQDRMIYRGKLLALLRPRELARVGTQLSTELGLHYAEPDPKSHEFTLAAGAGAQPQQGGLGHLHATRSPGRSAVSGAVQASGERPRSDWLAKIVCRARLRLDIGASARRAPLRP